MKRLILCCDGTWNKPDENSTNIIKIACRVAKRDADGISQIVYYDLGVGTGNLIDRVWGGVFGDGLEENIHDAYRFLIANYEEGDQIYLFGFSRGAFTARSIAGMIGKCGILKRCAVNKYEEAKELYRNPNVEPKDSMATQFRQTYSISDITPIEFIGVWDTVGSLGIPKDGGVSEQFKFHNTELSSSVKNAYHALAIDEYRAPFIPTLWTNPPNNGQIIEQVWFCGAHRDVGGGYEEQGLSDISLDWMIKAASNLGLEMDSSVLSAFPLTPNVRDTIHSPEKDFPHNFGKKAKRIIGREKDATGKYLKTLDATQTIHDSVLTRWDTDPSYRPSQLRDYFKFIGDYARANSP